MEDFMSIISNDINNLLFKGSSYQNDVFSQSLNQ